MVLIDLSHQLINSNFLQTWLEADVVVRAFLHGPGSAVFAGIRGELGTPIHEETDTIRAIFAKVAEVRAITRRLAKVKAVFDAVT